MRDQKHSPGVVRDAIFAYLGSRPEDATVAEIVRGVESRIGGVPASSVRSYLRLRPDAFHRTGHGRYALKRDVDESGRKVDDSNAQTEPVAIHGPAVLYQADCFDWLKAAEENSCHAIVTDPPYGLVEYSEKEQRKLRDGKGGVWRIPPSFDGHRRSPLPRFTTLSASDLQDMYEFFERFGGSVARVLVPGAHVFVASNPLVSHIVASALADSGLENRGVISRLVMTMRGGDRPKNAHEEFSGVTVMPRSMAEPWLLFRNPLEGRVQDNLRKWRTGGLRRISNKKPFGDVIASHPTRPVERRVAPHPSLKPQAFLRQIVRAALPLKRGVILDPFAGSGSTLAAANHIGYTSIGVEVSSRYVEIAQEAIPRLESLRCPDTPSARGAFECRTCQASPSVSPARFEDSDGSRLP
ncbi:MAG: site-specific DNA-methyltransferase [Rhodospirillaceae bacterium]|nr:site-specific DNA-methyltransferase [Rhodospirillaceae bacterium]